MKTPRGRYEALILECEKASQAFLEELQKAKTDDERNKIKREKSWEPRCYIGRFLEIAESAPDDPAAADALIWVVKFGFDGPEFSRAIDRLVQNHVEKRKVGRCRLDSAILVYPRRRRNCSAPSSRRTPTQLSRGGLAWHWAGTSNISPSGSAASGTTRNRPRPGRPCFSKKPRDKEYFSRFVGRDPDALMKEAEAAFERTIKEFGDTSRRGDSLKKDAQAELYEIRELCAGKPAPEITGQDIDGRPLKLSDFKRKVVVDRLLDNLMRRVPRHERVRATAREEDAR